MKFFPTPIKESSTTLSLKTREGRPSAVLAEAQAVVLAVDSAIFSAIYSARLAEAEQGPKVMIRRARI